VTGGAVVLGILNGLIIGLLAVGLVLVFRSNRFLNLAHAQLGALPALLLAKFVLDWGWAWGEAFVVCVAVGVLTGVVVDRALVRRLAARTASKVSLLLLTVGVTQVLLALTFVPALLPNANKLNVKGYPLPLHSHLRVGGVVLGGQYLLIMGLAPVLILGLAAFLRYSVLGKTIRAAASNPDAARLCGISTSNVSTITWGIAGGLAAITAVLQAPSYGGTNAAGLGPILLLLALGAAALGGFVSIIGALAGGLLIGLAQQLTLSITHNAGTAEFVVFLVILGIVLARGRVITTAFTDGGAVVQDRVPARIPDEVADRAIVRRRPWWLGGGAIAIGLLAPLLPYFRTEGHRFELALVLVYAVVAVSLTILVGWGGQVSLGHFAIVGLGAFVAARLGPHGWSLPVVLCFAGGCGALVMVLIGIPALRLRGFALAVTTLGLAVLAPDWLLRQRWVGSVQPFGIDVTPPRIVAGLGRPRSELAVYYVALAVLTLVVLGVRALRASAPGRLTIAVRDNERAAASFGITPATLKLAILALSGFIAAIGGVLWAQAWQTVSASQFPAELNFSVLAAPVIGGLGSAGGAVAGAAVLYLATYFLSPLLTGVFGSFGHQLGFQLAFGGAGLIAVLLVYPAGLAGAAEDLWQRFVAYLAASYRAHPDLVRTGLDAGTTPLAVEGVGISFGGVVALDEVDITVGAGEIVGLIGPNGAGKTTLMNVISGTLTPGRGAVRLNGRDVTQLPPELRSAFGLARSFQDASLFAGLTVTETIQVALTHSGRSGFVSALVGAPWSKAAERRSRVRALEIIDRLGLDAWAGTLTADLSTGTRRICDLAAQTAAGPKVLLLDEPTAGVAQRDAEAFGPLLRRIREELDCSILIVEHDMPLLMGLCDRVYAMESGRVIAEGTPSEIRADEAVIASYLGTDPTAIGRSGTVAAGRRSPPPPNRKPAVATRRPARRAGVAKTVTAGRAVRAAPRTRPITEKTDPVNGRTP